MTLFNFDFFKKKKKKSLFFLLFLIMFSAGCGLVSFNISLSILDIWNSQFYCLYISCLWEVTLVSSIQRDILHVGQMTITWTSGYNIDEAVPFVEWGLNGGMPERSPAVTLTFHQNSMCGIICFIYSRQHICSVFIISCLI